MQAFHEYIGRGVRYTGELLSQLFPPFVPFTTREVVNWWNRGATERIRCLNWYTVFAVGFLGLFEAYKLLWNTPKTLGFFVFVITVYTVITVGTSLLLDFPQQKLNRIPSSVNRNTAVIVASHRSEADIQAVLDRILLHFPPENVYVADNSESDIPPDKTGIICEEAGINYKYYPIPSKTSALLFTAESLPEKFNYVMCLDDDTLLPETPFDIDCDLFDQNTAGISYLLRVRDCHSRLSKVIQYEFLQLSWRNYFKSEMSTMKFLPGIVAVWRRDSFMQIYSRNPCRYSADKRYLPFGEDGWAGYIARSLGYTLKIDLRYPVYTRVPKKICCGDVHYQGYGSNTVWKQRAYRWYRNYLRRLPLEFLLLFTYSPKTKDCFRRKMVYFLDWLYGVFLMVSSLTTPIVIAELALGRVPLWIYLVVHSGMYVAGVLNGLWMRWYTLRNRSDLAPSYSTVALYPIFTSWIVLARLWGALGSIFYYIPCVSPNRSGQETRQFSSGASPRCLLSSDWYCLYALS